MDALAEELAQRLSGSLVLMGLGMAVVFVFLTLLVFTTKLVSRIVCRIGEGSVLKESKAQEHSDDAEIAVAIAAAASRR